MLAMKTTHMLQLYIYLGSAFYFMLSTVLCLWSGQGQAQKTLGKG